jgi:hypothetical protein
MPTVKKLEAMIGMIQCILLLALQPYQKRQIGRQADPKNVGGRTVSGVNHGLVNLGMMPYFTHIK